MSRSATPEHVAPRPPARRVLVVDDEASILAGLRRFLHHRPNGCEFVFANSGAEALDLLAAAPTDIVLSDMRMPAMDGATLLGQVRTLTPKTARVVLSGQTNAEAAVRAASVAHRFLDKPVAADVLRATIAELLESINTLTDDTARARLGALSALPSPETTCAQFGRALSAGADADALASACGGDIGIASKAFQLVSTGFFGPAGGIVSLRDAFARLGTTNLRSLHERDVLPATAPPALEAPARALAAHTLRVNHLAALIAGDHTNGTLNLACLLHAVGLLATADSVPGPAGEVDLTAQTIACDYLLTLWGIPRPVRGTIAAARVAGEACRPGSDATDDLASALAIADALDAEPCPFAGDWLRNAGMDPITLRRWRDLALQLVEEFP